LLESGISLRSSPHGRKTAMQKWIVGVFLSVVFSNGVTLADQPNKQNAVLVEVQRLPGCAGLDCPPWPTPPDIMFCFQVGETYYTGESRTAPWATSTEQLASLKGKSVEIAVTAKIIRVTASGLKFRLRRLHHASLFSSPGCSQTCSFHRPKS